MAYDIKLCSDKQNKLCSKKWGEIYSCILYPDIVCKSSMRNFERLMPILGTNSEKYTCI